jgi:hypothetical protein
VAPLSKSALDVTNKESEVDQNGAAIVEEVAVAVLSQARYLASAAHASRGDKNARLGLDRAALVSRGEDGVAP